MRTIHLSQMAMEPWAILPKSLAVISEILTRYFAGEKLSKEEIQARIGGEKPKERMLAVVNAAVSPSGARSADVNNGPVIAVLPLFGAIIPRADLFSEVSGATSAETFGKRFDAMLADPNVKAIVIDIDSPGGQVAGVMELSQKIFDARGSKPVVAVANHLMASAAYWIGSAADEIVTSPSADVGSIGVVAIHEDLSTALQQEGVKVNLISAAPYKTEGNPYEPLSEEARASIQMRVDEVYQQFLESVARNRGISAADVQSGYGEGRVLGAVKALASGMVDRVATMEETIARLQEDLASGNSAQGNQRNVAGKARCEAVPVSAGSGSLDTSEEVERLRNYVHVFGPMANPKG